MATKTEIVISAKDETKQAFDSVKGSLNRLSGLAGNLGFVGLAGSAATIVGLVQSTADFADEMDKAAQKVGFTTESLSGLKYAADLNDASFESLQTGLKKLSVNINEVLNGGKPMTDLFNQIGVSVRDANGKIKGTDEVFGEIANVFQSLPDGAQKTALAMQLLGKSGADLIPLLNGGASGISELTAEAQQFGLVIDSDVAKAADDFNDNIARLQASTRGLTLSLGQQLLPALSEITEVMAQATKEGGILYGLFVGLGGVATYAFGLDAASQAKDELVEINREITKIQGALSTGQKSTTTNGIVNLSTKEIDDYINKLKELGIKKAQLEGTVNPTRGKVKPPVPDEKELSPIASSGKSKIDQDIEAAKRFVENLQKQKDTFGLAKSAVIEYDAAQLKLNATQRVTVAQMVEQLKATEQLAIETEAWNEQIKLNNKFEEEQLSQLEDSSAAEEARQESLRTMAYELKKTLDPTIALAEEQDRLNQILAEGLIDDAEYTAGLQLAQDKLTELANKGNDDIKDLQRAVEGFGRDAGNAFVDFAFEGKSSVGDLVTSVLKDLARLSIQRKILDPIIGGFDGALTGDSTGGSGFFASLFGGFFADGGRPPMGKVSVVGERGPELFVPDSSGTIIPNNFGGGGNQYNVSVNVDATGGSVAGNDTKASELGRQIEGAVRGVLLKEKRPGGILA
jgi:uncharacterized phage infection (PIP) family protein YhgE